MLSICIFAFIGGVIVIRGFAARQVKTLEPGIVSADSILVSGKYRLEVVAGLRYCFRANSIENNSKLVVYSGRSEITQLKVVPENQETCFVPQNQTPETIEVTPMGAGITVEQIIIKML